MICRRIYQNKPWTLSQQWPRWCFYSSSAPTLAPGGGGGWETPGRLGQTYAFSHAATSFCSLNKFNFLNFPFSLKRCHFSAQALVDSPVGATVEVPLAQTGEGIAECELLKWFVQEGEHVEEFQPLCEVQSDKATIEITSRYKGKVSQIVHIPGDIVKVGETLLKMIVDESAVPTRISDASGSVEEHSSDTSDSDDQNSEIRKTRIGGVLSTPAVRNLAKQYGIDINDVCGSGKNGRVLREDVLSFGAQRGVIKENRALSAMYSAEQLGGDDVCAEFSSPYEGENEDETVALRGFQRAMVKSMTLAAKVPHFHYVEEINCNALVELKAVFQKENSDPNIKHTFLPLLIKALSMALNKYPFLNSCFNEEKCEVTLKGSHNIGIAMATPYGLVVPNIKRVQSLSILEITKELLRLQQLALTNKLSPEDVSGGTITLSNIGAIGGKFGSPLVNVPEVCIIAIGRIQKLPHFAEDENVYPMSMMTVNIGADHRVLDGATVARFCNEWKLFIEKPELLMLHTR